MTKAVQPAATHALIRSFPIRLVFGPDYVAVGQLLHSSGATDLLLVPFLQP